MKRTPGSAWPAAVLFVILSGCTPAQYAHQADETANAGIAEGQQAALGQREAFEVSYRPFTRSATQPAEIRIGTKVLPFGGGEPAILTSEDCLLVAFHNARDL